MGCLGELVVSVSITYRGIVVAIPLIVQRTSWIITYRGIIVVILLVVQRTSWMEGTHTLLYHWRKMKELAVTLTTLLPPSSLWTMLR